MRSRQALSRHGQARELRASESPVDSATSTQSLAQLGLAAKSPPQPTYAPASHTTIERRPLLCENPDSLALQFLMPCANPFSPHPSQIRRRHCCSRLPGGNLRCSLRQARPWTCERTATSPGLDLAPLSNCDTQTQRHASREVLCTDLSTLLAPNCSARVAVGYTPPPSPRSGR